MEIEPVLRQHLAGTDGGGERKEELAWTAVREGRTCTRPTAPPITGVSGGKVNRSHGHTGPAPFHGAIPSRLVAPPGGGPAKNQKS